MRRGLTLAGLGVMVPAVLAVQYGVDGVTALPAILQIAILGAIGALTYAGVVLLVWNLRGRGEGPVTEFVSIFRALGDRASSRLASSR